MLTKEFLESKISKSYSGWCGHETENRAQSGNIQRLSSDVFSFNHYNLLPSCEEDILDGHYIFFVNYKTFEYLVYKQSTYGSLTYTIPVEFEGFLTKENLPDSSRSVVESIIADKLLGTYFYDANHINHYGQNLIQGSTRKYSSISDWRGHTWSATEVQTYDDKELFALKKLANWEPPQIKDFSSKLVDKIVSDFTFEKGVEEQIDIQLNGKKYIIAHKESKQWGSMSAVIDENGNFVARELLKHNFTAFVKQIPIAIRNYAN